MRRVGLDFLADAAHVGHKRLPIAERIAPGGLAQRIGGDDAADIACERFEDGAFFHGEGKMLVRVEPVDVGVLQV